MRSVRVSLALAAALCASAAEEQPLTTARGAVNAVSLQSAPSVVAQGGILAVFGDQLAAAHTKPEGAPLPLALEDPAVEVSINGVAAPIFFVSPTQVNVLVPWEVEPGWADVVVRRGGLESSPMPVLVSEANPNLFTYVGSSALITQTGGDNPDAPQLGVDGPAPAASVGPANGAEQGQTITVFGAGLGQTDPAVASGALGAGATPVAEQRAYLGGLPIAVTSATLSADMVGVYKLEFEVPELASSGEVFRWYSGDIGSAAVWGAGGAPTPRYMTLGAELESPRRIDLSDLNPYFVALSGAVDELDFCYRNVQLLDFRRDSATTLEQCVFPSYPNAPNQNAYRPFERSMNSPVLAALTEPSGEISEGLTDQLLLIDTAAGSTAQVVQLSQPADRLQSALGESRNMRLLRPGDDTIYSLIDGEGAAVGELDGVAALPNPLEVDGMTVQVAQGASFGSGYRMRFLGPGAEAAEGRPVAVLFDRDSNVIAKVQFPDGWDPIEPPRRINNQGIPQGNSIATTQAGFRGDSTAYVLVRASDGSGDGVAAFRAALPEDSEEPVPESVDVETSVTAFPDGSYAATCHTQVRFQRIPLTQELAVVATSEMLNEFAIPQQNQICAGDQLVLFDTVAASTKAVPAPEPLDNVGKGAAGGYLYFADGAREVALQAAEKIHIFDGVSETFSTVEFEEDVGILFNNFNTMHRPVGQGQIVALATGGPTRVNRRGVTQPPLAGNRGLLVVDLPKAAAVHLALPEGFQRVVAVPNQVINQQGLRTFGMFPLIGRAFAYSQKPNAGPGNPGGTGILTWDIATAEATEIPLPEDGFAVVRRAGGGGRPGGGGGGPGSGGGGAALPYIWDWQPKSSSLAYGVYNRGGDLIAIGVVGPN
ncbi:MAG: hypothetical protein OXJ37_04035 [Bryobacterales bacterium]|nr:hypothetical protein [Bryobacterales bacterium]